MTCCIDIDDYLPNQFPLRTSVNVGLAACTARSGSDKGDFGNEFLELIRYTLIGGN
jgi:hypothetical protein